LTSTGPLLRSCNSRQSDLEDPAQARSRPLCSNACPTLLEGATTTGPRGRGRPWSDAAEAARTTKASARSKLTAASHLSFWARLICWDVVSNNFGTPSFLRRSVASRPGPWLLARDVTVCCVPDVVCKKSFPSNPLRKYQDFESKK
jgi:hypothetical protein